MDALRRQIGGTHYSEKAIQPIEYILANRLGFAEGCIIKYVTRYEEKGGVEDLIKAKHYLDFLIEFTANGNQVLDPDSVQGKRSASVMPPHGALVPQDF